MSIDALIARYPDGPQEGDYLRVTQAFLDSQPTEQQQALFNELLQFCALETHRATHALKNEMRDIREQIDSLDHRVERIEGIYAQAEIHYLQPTKH
ncbi:hypothetical protein MM188_003197 [Vibrio cholerae]|nr:hypothetical protein [Vibrio cholerae]